ncbi:response regulator [Cellvibrio fontiphilus]|uniref:Response regulator n=1 Tax=Cellvibrio fontiphilus TaxID=1815559 RepID=A0ABV7FCM6_9GAMM
MSVRLLLVEDDRELRATLREALLVEGYQVLTAASLAEAIAMYGQTQMDEASAPAFDVILLDLGLPDGDGSALLLKLRRRNSTPVIIISAREAEGQKIRLLDQGADDYLVKPFSIGELLARIRVALRHRGNPLRAAITRYEQGDLIIDLASHRVSRKNDVVHLTPTEFNLLARLVRSAGQVVTHRQLLVDVWGQEYLEHTHYLRLYMGQLRAKLEDNPAEPQLLLTEPGVGYRLLDTES